MIGLPRYRPHLTIAGCNAVAIAEACPTCSTVRSFIETGVRGRANHQRELVLINPVSNNISARDVVRTPYIASCQGYPGNAYGTPSAAPVGCAIRLPDICGVETPVC